MPKHLFDTPAYHSDPALKTFVLAQIAAHVEADELIKDATDARTV